MPSLSKHRHELFFQQDVNVLDDLNSRGGGVVVQAKVVVKFRTRVLTVVKIMHA